MYSRETFMGEQTVNVIKSRGSIYASAREYIAPSYEGAKGSLSQLFFGMRIDSVADIRYLLTKQASIGFFAAANK